jgi:hypothetical protein
MFNFFGKKQPTPPAPPTIRDTLFGDLALSQWPTGQGVSPEQEPWSSFIRAREAIDKKKTTDALRLWQSIVQMPNLESRHYVQAWHFLRQHGVQPAAAQAKTVYGVVVEVSMQQGLDLLAAYLDGTARYYNYTGSGIIWDKPTSDLDEPIKGLLDAGQQIVHMIGPWEEARPPAPTGGQVRLSMLTPSGLHFGQGTFANLSSDPKGQALVTNATNLMIAMTNLGQQKS